MVAGVVVLGAAVAATVVLTQPGSDQAQFGPVQVVVEQEITQQDQHLVEILLEESRCQASVVGVHLQGQVHGELVEALPQGGVGIEAQRLEGFLGRLARGPGRPVSHRKVDDQANQRSTVVGDEHRLGSLGGRPALHWRGGQRSAEQ